MDEWMEYVLLEKNQNSKHTFFHKKKPTVVTLLNKLLEDS